MAQSKPDDLQQALEKTPDSREAGSVERQRSASQDGTLIPATLYNLMIAEQYIDETAFPAEHKLVCFHYGVALLAAHRDNRAKRALASQYLGIASGWQAGEDATEETRQAIERVASESHYNLGVIEELNGDCEQAIEHYRYAISLANQYATGSNESESAHPGILYNVAIVAQLGMISCDMELIKRSLQAARPETTPDTPESEIVREAPSLSTAEQEARIETTRNSIVDLRSQIRALPARLRGARSHQAMPPTNTGTPEPRGFLGFLRRAKSPPQPAPVPEHSPMSESPAVALRGQEVLHAIESKLSEFERKLNEMSRTPRS